MATQPDLGINNPYALDDNQFNAAIDLLQPAERAHRRVLVGLPQGDPGLQERRLGSRHDLADHREPRPGRQGEGRGVLPKEGATGWSDTWMVATKAKNKNCAYMWIDHIISPKANAAVAEWFGEAPCNQVVRGDRPTRTTARRSTPRTRTTSTRSGTGPRRSSSASTAERTSVQGLRRLDDGLARRSRASPRMSQQDTRRAVARAAAVGLPAPDPGLRLTLLLAAPMLVAGRRLPRALAALLLSPPSGRPTLHRRDRAGSHVRQLPLDRRPTRSTGPSRCASIGVAAAVTVICAVIAFPMALFMAKVAPPAVAPLLVVAAPDPAVGQLSGQGLRLAGDAAGERRRSTGRWLRFGLASPGFGLTAMVIVLTYLWLPFMILPVYAGLERMPDSMLEASADLGAQAGAHVPLGRRCRWCSRRWSPARSSPSRSAWATTSPRRSSAARRQLIGNVVYTNIVRGQQPAVRRRDGDRAGRDHGRLTCSASAAPARWTIYEHPTASEPVIAVPRRRASSLAAVTALGLAFIYVPLLVVAGQLVQLRPHVRLAAARVHH